MYSAGEESEAEDDAQTDVLSSELVIDVKRPRIAGEVDDDDIPPEPPLTVPDVETIPLPPPFFTRATSVDTIAADAESIRSGDQENSITETTRLVNEDALQSISNVLSQDDSDQIQVPSEPSQHKRPQKTFHARRNWRIGLLADDEGYLLDAFLSRLHNRAKPGAPISILLQALVAIPKTSSSTLPAPVKFGFYDSSSSTCLIFATKDEAKEAFYNRFRALTGYLWAERDDQMRMLQLTETAVKKGYVKKDEYLYLPANHRAISVDKLQEADTKISRGHVLSSEFAFPAPGRI